MMVLELPGSNHKARVITDGTDATLQSYETEVAFLINGRLFRAEGQPQSATTARHMREFFMQNGLPYMTKKQLEALPTKED
jgi:hypothetical protein